MELVVEAAHLVGAPLEPHAAVVGAAEEVGSLGESRRPPARHLQLGVLLGGAVITEMIFSWPGIGQLAVEAIQKRDYPLLQASVLVISPPMMTVATG